MAKITRNDQEFLVQLNGLKLSNDQLERINKGINEVVMREVANTDKGAVVAFRPSGLGPKWPTIPPRGPIIWGIVVIRHDLIDKALLDNAERIQG